MAATGIITEERGTGLEEMCLRLPVEGRDQCQKIPGEEYQKTSHPLHSGAGKDRLETEMGQFLLQEGDKSRYFTF